MQMGGAAAFCGSTAPRCCVLAGEKVKSVDDYHRGRRERPEDTESG